MKDIYRYFRKKDYDKIMSILKNSTDKKEIMLCIEALGFSKYKKCTTLLLKFTKSNDDDIVIKTLRALRRLGFDYDNELFLDLLYHPNVKVVLETLTVLEATLIFFKKIDVETILPLLSNEHVIIRVCAARFLTLIGCYQGFDLLYQIALMGKEGNIKKIAIVSLGNIRREETLIAFSEIFAKGDLVNNSCILQQISKWDKYHLNSLYCDIVKNNNSKELVEKLDVMMEYLRGVSNLNYHEDILSTILEQDDLENLSSNDYKEEDTKDLNENMDISDSEFCDIIHDKKFILIILEFVLKTLKDAMSRFDYDINMNWAHQYFDSAEKMYERYKKEKGNDEHIERMFDKAMSLFEEFEEENEN